MRYTLRADQPVTRARAFTLMEVLIAIGIFAIGMVAVAAVFPTAIFLQKQTITDATSQQVARNAAAVLQATKMTYKWYPPVIFPVPQVNPAQGSLRNYYQTAGVGYGRVKALSICDS